MVYSRVRATVTIATVAVARGDGVVVNANLPAANLNCLLHGYVYEPVMTGVPITKKGTEDECQLHCRNTAGVAVFTYFKASTDCWCGDSSAILQAATNPDDAVGGKATCPTPTAEPPSRCRSELPVNGFPGMDQTATDGAWASGRQPEKLECWPMGTSTGEYLPCKEYAVLEDTETGWPGKCDGFTLVPHIGYACDINCMQNPKCSAWQIGTDHGCWQGLGTDCFMRPNFHPVKAQRVQQGSVRVLMTLKEWHITGLTQVFGPRGANIGDTESFFQTDDMTVPYCRNACYSDISCEYWTYSTISGCFIEDVSKQSVAYPLTLSDATRGSDEAMATIAGEYIQRYCPAEQTTTYGPTPVPFSYCNITGYSYEPADMPGTDSNSGRTIVANAMLCQMRCAYTKDCAHWQYWPEDGFCHVTNAAAVMVEDASAVSGPRECPATTPPPGLSLFGGRTTNSNEQNKMAMALPNEVGSLIMKMDVPNLTFSSLSDVQVAELRSAYATDLAACIGIASTLIMDMDKKKNYVTVKACPDDDGNGQACPAGTVIKGLLPPIEGKTIRDVGLVISTTRCAGIYGIVFNTTDIEVMQPLSISNPRASPYIIPEYEPTPWYELWWLWLIVALVLCIVGAVVAKILTDKSGARSMTARGLADSDGDFAAGTTDRDLELDDSLRLEELPFPDTPMADRNELKKPIIIVPFPDAGYGMPVSAQPSPDRAAAARGAQEALLSHSSSQFQQPMQTQGRYQQVPFGSNANRAVE